MGLYKFEVVFMKKLVAILLMITMILAAVPSYNALAEEPILSEAFVNGLKKVRVERDAEPGLIKVVYEDYEFYFEASHLDTPEFADAFVALVTEAESGPMSYSEFNNAAIKLMELGQELNNNLYFEEIIMEEEAYYGVEATAAECLFDATTGTVLKVLNDGVILYIPDVYDGVRVIDIKEGAIKGKTLMKELILPPGFKSHDAVIVEDCPELVAISDFCGTATVRPYRNCPLYSYPIEYYMKPSDIEHRVAKRFERVHFGKAFATASGTIIGDGYNYNWESNLTRAEALTIILRLMGLNELANGKINEQPLFADVMTEAPWANGYINLAKEMGITEGVGNGRFNPNGQCTAQDFITMMFRLTKLQENKDYSWQTATSDFYDVLCETEKVWRDTQDGIGFPMLSYFFESAAETLGLYHNLSTNFCREAAADVIFYMLHIIAGENYISLADILANEYGMSEAVLYNHYARRSEAGIDPQIAALSSQRGYKSSEDADFSAISYALSDEYEAILQQNIGKSVFATQYYGTPGNDTDALVSKAKELTQNLSGEQEKAEAISYWISTHIFYDWDNYNDKNNANQDASTVFATRKGVCAGYANLTQAMLNAVGITCAQESSVDHAWNVAFLDGEWALIDNTKASYCTYKDGRYTFYEEEVTDYMEPGVQEWDRELFDADPYAFYSAVSHVIRRYPGK